MKENKGFKETEIGLIPEHWEVVRLGQVVKTIKGKKPKILSENPSKNSLPYLTAEYFRYGIPNQFVNIEVEKELPVCKKEDVVLIWDGSKAGQVFTGLEGILASTMVKINPIINNLDKSYLHHFLTTKFDYLNSQTTGSTIPHINKTVFLNLPIPLPPLDEQKAIADILSTVQNAIEKTEKVINATKQLKKSMMKHLFTYGAVAVDKIDKVKLKESEIGLIPEDWKVVRLENVMEGFTPNKKLKQSDYKAIGKFPVIDQGQEYVAGFYDDETMVFDKDLPVILFGDHTRIIKYVDFPFICGADGLKIIIPKENFHRKYFYYALLNLNIPSRGYNRHFKILKEKLIPLPPLDEQQKIANILTTIDQKIQAEEKKKIALKNLFKTLLQQLMTGKIRVRHPS